MTAQTPADSLLTQAMRKHLDGDLVSAEAIYKAMLQNDPDDARAHHYLGFLLQQSARFDEAQTHLSRAIALDDSHAEWHFNLGIVTSKLGQLDACITAFSKALSIDPGKYFYWTNLGAAYELNQESERAEHSYLAAINLDPVCPDAFYLLSALCLKLERYTDARHFNYRGILASPENSTSMIVRGQAYHELGRTADAVTLLENWQLAETDNPVAAHLLAAYRDQLIPEQCSTAYIEQTFDAFANNFDATLKKLKYCGPVLVRDHLATLDLPAFSLDILDLGCGTGLIGAELRPCSRTLTGVDLSLAMLEQSAAKQHYHRLHQASIADFLRSSNEQYDLITCMDTFIYLGSLEEVCALIFQRLRNAGCLLFSTEKLEVTQEQGFRLNVSGRYSHTQDYLTRVLLCAGFQIQHMHDVTIRNEAGCPIQGQFICASRRD
jgi:predicted TPR repeat methyltransferase